MRKIGIRCAALPAALALIGATSVMGQADRPQQPQQPGQYQQVQHEQQHQQHLKAQGQHDQRKGDLIRGSELLKKRVQNPQGERLGTIEEVVADVSNGRIAYAVVSFGGILGIGDDLYAIPWDALKNTHDDSDFVVLDIPRQQLEQAQGFNRKNWPDMGDPQFLQRTYQHYGVEPYEVTRPGDRRMERIDPAHRDTQRVRPNQEHGMQRPATQQQPGATQDQQRLQQPGATTQDQQRLQQQPGTTQDQQRLQREQQQRAQQQGVQGQQQRQGQLADRDDVRQEVQLERRAFWVNRVSDLIGLNVEDQQQENLGKLRDVVIDTREGRIVYGVLGFGGVLGIGETYAAVPWRELDIRPAREAFVLNADRQRLERISFASGDWPNLQDQQWAVRVHQEFQAQPYWEIHGYPAPGEDRQGVQPMRPGMQDEHRELHQQQQQEHREFHQQQDNGWSPQSRYNQQYNAQQMQTIRGTIVQVGSFRPQAGDPEGVSLQVRDQQGKIHTIHLAPKAYMDRQQAELKANQQVQIKASTAQIDGREICLAQEIEVDGKTIQLRDQQGRGQWTQADLQQPGQQRPGMQTQQPGQPQQRPGQTR